VPPDCIGNDSCTQADQYIRQRHCFQRVSPLMTGEIKWDSAFWSRRLRCLVETTTVFFGKLLPGA
jgi:hypothetical protein